jgi:NADH-quinone oxidoreductase subunit N
VEDFVDNILAALVETYGFILSEMLLALAACVLFLLATFRANRHVAAGLALASLAGALLLHATATAAGYSTPAIAEAGLFSGPLAPGHFADLIRVIALGGGLVLALFSWYEVPDRQACEFHACLLLITAGVSLTGAANDLVVLFLSLELVSIPTYVLLYLPKHDGASQEAALKYFLLSVFSSALVLFGFSYLYGLAGTTNLGALFDTLRRGNSRDLPAIAHIAVITVIAGLGFRITAAPFHFYAPDVYQGAPTVAAALLAFVPKVAGFAALLRVLGYVTAPGIPPGAGLIGMDLSTQVPVVFWFLAVVTMFAGNVMALWQDNLKRLLAYSSVAHAGYMLVALAVAPYLRGNQPSIEPDAVEAVLYYLVAYGAMTIGAFAVLAYLDSAEKPVETVDDLAGLSRSHPLVALAMTVFLFSLIGIPLTAGFTAKFLVFFGAVAVPSADHWMQSRLLPILAAINAAIGGWYYLRIVAVMYLRNPLRPLVGRRTVPGLITVVLCVVLTVGLSVPPGAQWLLQASRSAAGFRTEAAAK